MSERRPEEPVVVRDRRRIDPLTGEARRPAGPTAGSGPAPTEEASTDTEAEEPTETATADLADDKLAQLSAQLDERTADLQRVSAEYANYRRRVERDRQVVIESAKAQVASQLLTVLDDIERAQQHGDLSGAFKAVADKVVAVLQAQGLEPFGRIGDGFDPGIHEAVQHSTSPDVDKPTVTAVLRFGYRFGERVLRPAMVAVTDRDPDAPHLATAPDATPETPPDDGAGAAHEHD